MRIVLVILSLLAVFMITISIMVDNLKDKTDEVKTKISKWYIEDNYLNLELGFKIQEKLFFSKDIYCTLYNDKKEEFQILEKRVQVELKESGYRLINIGEVKGKVKYIDCNFIKN